MRGFLYTKNDHFTKTGSGQTREKLMGKAFFAGRISLWDPAPTSAEKNHPNLCGTADDVAKVLNALPRDPKDAQVPVLELHRI
jgi:hypothetical protein